ncbi:hypothetical protein [Spirosoma spitsbergense]|uniref:hypothetical protein n=1 Tax=Spirosoma spitsbergense TaxID=431554 RepID=UPI00036FB8DC|nr:hypothetical protein [Spirosoma spitsbergense]
MAFGLEILSSMISAMIGVGADEVFKNTENKRKFEKDLETFLNRQLSDTNLEIFHFADIPDNKNYSDKIPLERIYIPLRLNQITGTTPFIEDFMKKPTDIKGLGKQKLKNLNIAHLLDFIKSNPSLKKVLIVGQAGSGKSTFQKYLTRLLSNAKDNNHKVNVVSRGKLIVEEISLLYIPIYIKLRDLDEELKRYNRSNWKENFTLELFLENKYNISFQTTSFYSLLTSYAPCLWVQFKLSQPCRSLGHA